ncbi:cold-shock protein [Smaragdicoccus niigatensis]|uniref:cold-shock protein n=1 Tax=Smaragdicoccus niigatensis TaxID=359359 RepID=UPI0003823E4F|nr:cold-shock protein [Smaragdicoccus niigatensis]
MPTGKVKWYDVEKGFGFLSQDEGEDVYVRSSALPKGVEGLKPGQRVEFGMAAGRKGPQALTVKVLDPIPSVTTSQRTERPRSEPAPKKYTADVLHGLIEDTIKTLESTIQPSLQQGRYPDRAHSKKIAEILRTLARELDH